MLMQYSVVGGHLKIHRNVFIQEMLRKDSKLRALLNWKNAKDFAAHHPSLSEPYREKDVIDIDFSSTPAIDILEAPKEILSELKSRYKEKIKGRVACRSVYSMYSGVFHFEIDMNSDSGDIEYVMQK